jgi:hypothetical protein
MTTEVDALILRYLQNLEAELHDLPANRRQELLEEVGEHIAAARAGLGTVMTSAGGSRAVGSAPPGPSETNLTGVILVVAPFVLPIVAAIYLGVRLRASTAVAATPPS